MLRNNYKISLKWLTMHVSFQQQNFCFCGRAARFPSDAEETTGCDYQCMNTDETCGGEGDQLEVFSFTTGWATNNISSR